MLVEVTIEDIKNGIIRSCSKCPVATAISRALKENNVEFDSIAVITNYFHLYSNGKVCEFAGEIHAPLPKKVEQFIYAFDSNKNVEPFSFELPCLEPRSNWYA